MTGWVERGWTDDDGNRWVTTADGARNLGPNPYLSANHGGAVSILDKVNARATEIIGDVEASELRPVVKYGHTLPTADGTCVNCGTPIVYNLRVGLCQHTADTDCADPFPA